MPGVKGSTVYVSGRQRAKGEINGKSANLNNCLKNIVYPQYVGNPAAIPKEEVLVVFDADMQAKPYFFCKVGAWGAGRVGAGPTAAACGSNCPPSTYMYNVC